MEDNASKMHTSDIEDKPKTVSTAGSNKENSNELSNTPDSSKNVTCDAKQVASEDAFEELKSQIASTIPAEYSSEELAYYPNVFGPGQPNVQFLRIHCTACQIHLGTAPADVDKRYIHPLLKVLVCYSCYDFYCSGEFEKDEDGSELYCRWCGEGGNVLCCSKCPYVFCKNCINRNVGKKKLQEIKESDDWSCFVCEQSQLIKLRVICRALYDYSMAELKLAKATNDVARLGKDCGICCNRKPKSQPLKRKRSSSSDSFYNPHLDNIDDGVKKTRHQLQLRARQNPPNTTDNNRRVVWETQEKAEVVCTPDVTVFMDDEETEVNKYPEQEPPPLTPIVAVVNNGIGAMGNSHITSLTTLPMMTPICAINTSTLNLMPILPTKQIVQPITTPTLNLSKSVVGNGQSIVTVTHNVKHLKSNVRLVPGLKYPWFENATNLSLTASQTLMTKLNDLKFSQRSISSLQELAGVHNKLQEILSSSVNSLIQIRKNLRNEFLSSLNDLKFTIDVPAAATPAPPVTIINSNEDDDVILVEEQPPLSTEFVSVNSSRKTFIKVKPMSSLINGDETIAVVDETPKVEEKIEEIKNNNVKEDITKDCIEKESEPSKQDQANLCEEDENLNPEVLKQIQEAIHLSKLEQLLYGIDISTEELTKKISSKELLNEISDENQTTNGKSGILSKLKKTEAEKVVDSNLKNEEMLDIEQFLEKNIVTKSSFPKIQHKVNDTEDEVK